MNGQTNLIEKAAKIAIFAHSGQKRKDSDTPYIIHPFMVALKLVKYNFPDTVIAAALVHDVLEDTGFKEERLRKELGDQVLAITKTVSEEIKDKSLLWEERKKKYIEVLRNGSEGAKAVSVADKIHNLENFISAYKKQGPDLWKKFSRGKSKKIWFWKQVFKALKETWQHPLVDEYEKLLAQVEDLV